MLFPTFGFALFFAIVYPVSWVLARRSTAWRGFVLAVSYVFYGAFDWGHSYVGLQYTALLAVSTLVNAALARGIHRALPGSPARRLALAAALLFNLGILAWFKYALFLAQTGNDLLRWLEVSDRIPLVKLALPVGISFFTFQAISYAVDVYRGLAPVATLDFAVYLAFFPHVVAGPIVRAIEFVPQLAQERRLTKADASRAAWLIGGGLFKKVVVSSYLATALVDPVFGAPERFSAVEILAAIYGYAVQIFADFSGYTDMAIGLALLLGIRFPQNFDRPYAAASIQDFWRRWHMTLSRWLRDYLYIPLGGSRKGGLRTYANLMITMTLGGLWHGASLTFVAWGLWQGLGLAAERAWGRGGRRQVLGRLATFHFICLGWVLFRAQGRGLEGFQLAGTLLTRLATAWTVPPATVIGPLLVAVAMIFWQQLPGRSMTGLERGFGRLPLVVQGAALGAFIFLCIMLGPRGVAPYIYFQF